MNPTIFIVSYKHDFAYLKFCLMSITKFATGFDAVVIVPNQDADEAIKLIRETCPKCALRTGDEWKDKGMLWAMAQKCHADELCPKSEIIFHIDSDCVFREPVTPEDYMVEGKPMLLYESFASLGKQRPDVVPWQACTQKCLPFHVQYETMRRHPSVYHRNLYPIARKLVEHKTGMSFDEYVKKQRNEFPQTFCEHVTLGSVALMCCQGSYHLINLEKEPWPKNKLYQGWSHAGMRNEDMAVFKSVGLA